MTEDWGSRLGFAEEFCEIWRFKKKVFRHVNTYCLLITQLHFVTIVAGSKQFWNNVSNTGFPGTGCRRSESGYPPLLCQ